MKQKKYTTYSEDGAEYEFNIEFFKEHFKSEARRRKAQITEFEKQLAKAVYVDCSAVHSWRNAVTTPGDLEKVELIAQFLGVQKNLLLVESKTFELEDEEMTNESKEKKSYISFEECKRFELDSVEKAELSKVYNKMLDFVDDYYQLCSSYGSYEHDIDTIFELEAAIRSNQSLRDELFNSGTIDDRLLYDIEDVLVRWESIVEEKRMEAEKVVLSSMMILPAEIYLYVAAVAEKVLSEGETNYIADYYGENGWEDSKGSWENCQEMMTHAEWIKSIFKNDFFVLRAAIR